MRPELIFLGLGPVAQKRVEDVLVGIVGLQEKKVAILLYEELVQLFIFPTLFGKGQLDALEDDYQGSEALLPVDDVVEAILCGARFLNFQSAVTDYRRHEMVIFGVVRHQLQQIAKQILSLLAFPTVKALIMWNTKNPVTKSSLRVTYFGSIIVRFLLLLTDHLSSATGPIAHALIAVGRTTRFGKHADEWPDATYYNARTG
jgi:hypothetical protein